MLNMNSSVTIEVNTLNLRDAFFNLTITYAYASAKVIHSGRDTLSMSKYTPSRIP